MWDDHKQDRQGLVTEVRVEKGKRDGVVGGEGRLSTRQTSNYRTPHAMGTPRVRTQRVSQRPLWGQLSNKRRGATQEGEENRV